MSNRCNLPSISRWDGIESNGCYSETAAGRPFGVRRTVFGILVGVAIGMLLDFAIDFRALALALIS